MNGTHFDALLRALAVGALSRRKAVSSLSGLALLGGLVGRDPDDAEARKRMVRAR